MLLQTTKKWALSLQQTIFPSICCLCKQPSWQKMSLCHSCTQSIFLLPSTHCKKCGLPLEETECLFCSRNALQFLSSNQSIFALGGGIQTLLHKAKYQKDWTCLNVLLQLSCLHWHFLQMPFSPTSLVCCVPSSFATQRKRLFCLPHELLKANIPRTQRASLLRKKKNLQQQASLSAEERKKNMEHLFEIPDNKKKQTEGKIIFLLDDVFTTGNTLEACAKELQKAGAQAVHGITLARALPW